MHPDPVVVERIARWAAGKRNVLAAGLAGSKVILLAEEVTAYTQHADWIGELGATRVVRTERRGPVTERRLALTSGLELDVDVAPPSWASVVPLDPGTKRVVQDGFRILHDPHGLLAALVTAVGTRP